MSKFQQASGSRSRSPAGPYARPANNTNNTGPTFAEFTKLKGQVKDTYDGLVSHSRAASTHHDSLKTSLEQQIRNLNATVQKLVESHETQKEVAESAKYQLEAALGRVHELEKQNAERPEREMKLGNFAEGESQAAVPSVAPGKLPVDSMESDESGARALERFDHLEKEFSNLSTSVNLSVTAMSTRLEEFAPKARKMCKADVKFYFDELVANHSDLLQRTQQVERDRLLMERENLIRQKENLNLEIQKLNLEKEKLHSENRKLSQVSSDPRATKHQAFSSSSRNQPAPIPSYINQTPPAPYNPTLPEVEKLKSEVREAERKIESLETRFEIGLAGQERELEEMKTKLSKVGGDLEVSELQGINRVESLGEVIRKFKKSITSSTEISTIKSTIASHAQKFSALEISLQQEMLQHSIDGRNNYNESIKAEVDKIQTDLNTLHQGLDLITNAENEVSLKKMVVDELELHYPLSEFRSMIGTFTSQKIEQLHEEVEVDTKRINLLEQNMILVDQNHKATVLRMIQVGSLLDKTMLVLRPLMPVLQGLQKNGNNGAGAVEPQK